jgi:hypothetical protein
MLSRLTVPFEPGHVTSLAHPDGTSALLQRQARRMAADPNWVLSEAWSVPVPRLFASRCARCTWRPGPATPHGHDLAENGTLARLGWSDEELRFPGDRPYIAGDGTAVATGERTLAPGLQDRPYQSLRG